MIRKTIAVLFIIIFALLAIPTFFLRSITTTYLDPKFYEGPFLDEAYSYAVQFVSSEINNDAQVSQYYSTDEIERLIEQNFTKDIARELTTDFVGQLKAISDKRKTDSIKISLLPVKENIAKMSGIIAERMIDEIPACPEDDAIDAVNGTEMPQCIPSETDRIRLLSEMTSGIEKRLTNAIPGELTIETTQEEQASQLRLFEVLGVVHYAEMILPLFMLIFLMLIMLTIYKPYTRVMGYSGAAILAGGIFGLVVVQLLRYVPGIINDTGAGTDILNLSTLLIGIFTQKMTIYSLWFMGIGLIIILLAVFLKKSSNPHNQKA